MVPQPAIRDGLEKPAPESLSHPEKALTYDAVVVVSFGGPERREDVLPFLQNVLRGRNVPRERMLEVAEHYYRLGGCSPIGPATRAMTAALERELAARGLPLTVFQGNRNWHPLLTDTLRVMADQGVRRALALVTSAFGSYSGCRQYLEDIERARQQAAAAGAAVPEVDKIRLFYNHPGYLALVAEQVREARRQRPRARLLFTAHSIPLAMAAVSPYERQLREACSLTAAAVGAQSWQLAYQSRSGPPSQPWLEPSVEEVLSAMQRDGAEGVILIPIGFLSDHMEVVYDLDLEAREHCATLGLPMLRVKTPGDHPGFAAVLCDLIEERLHPGRPRAALGDSGCWPDACAPGCCLVQRH